MIHYIYKVTCPSGKYYVGRHSTKKLNDNYIGSGKWVRSLKDKTKLIKDILEYCDNSIILKEREKFYIEENIGKINCMNFNNNPVGFSSGMLNCATTLEEKDKRRKRMMGDNNPMKKEEIRKKVSKANKGKPSLFKGKTHSEESKNKFSISAKNRKITEKGRQKLSEARKKNYEETKKRFKGWPGYPHTEESKLKIKEAAKKRKKVECEFCNKLISVNIYARFHSKNCKALRNGEA